MPRSYDQFYQQKRKYLSEQVREGIVSESDAAGIRELCDAFDENKPTVSKPEWPDAPANITGYREQSTLANWMYFLTVYAKHVELLETTADEINEVAESFLNGTAEYKDGSISKGSIRAYQNSARLFYRYHDDVGVSHTDIQVFEAKDPSLDPRDMLEPEEIETIRGVPDHPRDAAIVDMLLYTGLRNRGLRSLRIKDVDPDEGKYYFNTDADGLKNIYKPTVGRPLLGATAAVREWLKYHPFGDDEEAYFIVGKPKYGNVDPHEMVSDRTIERVMKSIKEEAEITKPLHPHMMRHNFVTICKREYDLPSDTVKFLIGHAPDSTIMETTYAHLSGEDHIQKAEVAAGLREESEESSFTPDFCPTCDEPLPTAAKACSRCGTVFTPDAKSAQDQIKGTVHEAKDAADTLEEHKDLDKLERLIDENPELIDVLESMAED